MPRRRARRARGLAQRVAEWLELPGVRGALLTEGECASRLADGATLDVACVDELPALVAEGAVWEPWPASFLAATRTALVGRGDTAASPDATAVLVVDDADGLGESASRMVPWDRVHGLPPLP